MVQINFNILSKIDDAGTFAETLVFLLLWFTLVLFSLNFLVGLLIILRYLIPLKINSRLIALFYMFAILHTIGYIIADITRIMNPKNIFYDYDDPPQLNIA